jgi:hypothetical protein
MKLSKIHINSGNPRIIQDAKFDKLCQSVREFPKMMELRPIIVDKNGMILGGNMRFSALQKLGYKDIPDNWVKYADQLSEEEIKRFIIEDNVSMGEWDMDIIEKEWDKDLLFDWGVDLPSLDIPKSFKRKKARKTQGVQIEKKESIHVTCPKCQEEFDADIT